MSQSGSPSHGARDTGRLPLADTGSHSHWHAGLTVALADWSWSESESGESLRLHWHPLAGRDGGTTISALAKRYRRRLPA